jgi:hypothetical protein
MGTDAVPAIPALMDIVNDDRNWLVPGYSLYVNRDRALSISVRAQLLLEKLIPRANGFGFDYARSLLLSPITTSLDDSEIMKRIILVNLLPEYGDEAMPVLITIINTRGISPREGNTWHPHAGSYNLWHVQTASTNALCQYGAKSIDIICEILRNYENDEAKSVASTCLLGREHLTDSGGEVDQQRALQQSCAHHLDNK